MKMEVIIKISPDDKQDGSNLEEKFYYSKERYLFIMYDGKIFELREEIYHLLGSKME